jgi:hypothetical protein
LTAEELSEPYAIDYESKSAVDVDGDFTWETAGKPVDDVKKAVKGAGGRGGHGTKKPDQKTEQKNKTEKKALFGGKSKKEPVLPTSANNGKSDDATEKEEKPAEEKPFELKNLKFRVPKGAFVAIVGRVGSGKVMQFRSNHVQIVDFFLIFSEFAFAGTDWRNAKDKG